MTDRNRPTVMLSHSHTVTRWRFGGLCVMFTNVEWSFSSAVSPPLGLIKALVNIQPNYVSWKVLWECTILNLNTYFYTAAVT